MPFEKRDFSLTQASLRDLDEMEMKMAPRLGRLSAFFIQHVLSLLGWWLIYAWILGAQVLSGSHPFLEYLRYYQEAWHRTDSSDP